MLNKMGSFLWSDIWTSQLTTRTKTSNIVGMKKRWKPQRKTFLKCSPTGRQSHFCCNFRSKPGECPRSRIRPSHANNLSEQLSENFSKEGIKRPENGRTTRASNELIFRFRCYDDTTGPRWCLKANCNGLLSRVQASFHTNILQCDRCRGIPS